ncbi:RNA 2',3'-cyclic phosphodiesterase [Caballeronia sp. LZ034LL]|uniref:RNA 2',3'-cyclic phosphodiesterase n=1 Tax=Caballeronia sp. LZ034LL TaxID=3038567 RepID=UPI0028543F88|nr:RNA 2',3'-cyclic phosphodiesterase [Caballeronia sp. LZ034LL]MDR5833712.1 RNA 2',3'-cyclic phosphodiesterase [Caballeronia sp. LZ034LL]
MSRPEVSASAAHSLFFAVFPDEAAAARLAGLSTQLRAQYGVKARAIPPERLHVTLHYLGAFAGLPDELIARAQAAASSIALPPAEVLLARIESFASRRAKRPLVLSGDASPSLHALEHTLHAALADAGIAVKRHPRFVPHVTLLYDEQRVPPHAIAPVAWRACEFALVRSLLGQSRHEVLARWPLEG